MIQVNPKNEIYKSGETLRRTLESHTGLKFIYAGQNIEDIYPLGTISRVSETPRGLSFLTLSKDVPAKEEVNQIFEVVYQISYITTAERTIDFEKSRFSASAVLNAIRMSWKLSSFRHLLKTNKTALNVDMNILDIGPIMTFKEEEGEQVQMPASIDITINVLDKITDADPAPCVEDPANLPDFVLNLNP